MRHALRKIQSNEPLLNCFWIVSGGNSHNTYSYSRFIITTNKEIVWSIKDSTIRVKGIIELLDNKDRPESEFILVSYQEKQEFIEDCPFGNVVLAAFTTAYARLDLYETFERFDSRVLNFDTDSIIYQHVEGLFTPTIGGNLSAQDS